MEVQGYPDYLIYDDGRIYSKNRDKFLIPQITHDGYHYVNLCKYGKKKTFKVHRLVAIHYIPNPENKPQVDHIDRDKSNNHVSNLRWATNTENQQNRGVQKDNKLGIKNICYNKRDNCYHYEKVIRGKCHQKCFKTLDEAIAYKEEYESNLLL